MFIDIAIQDLVLVDKARVPFKPGLNIISGETGAGKSALLNGLKLIAGEKGGRDWIRNGAQKAIVEARFIAPHLNELLKELGFETDEILVLR
ncbi:MAG: AAA family ATPase, partial [Parachlamydiaceae bacterium]